MKKNIAILSLIILFITIILITGCISLGTDDEPEPTNSLIGTWEWTNDQNPSYAYWEFSNDNTGKMFVKSYSTGKLHLTGSFTYVVSKTSNMVFIDFTSFSKDYTYRIDGRTLYLGSSPMILEYYGDPGSFEI